MKGLRRIFNGLAFSFPFVTRRRTLLGRAGYGFAAWALGIAPGGASAAPKKLQLPTHEQLPRLTALADAIIPRDDEPGAIDSGVPQRLVILIQYDPNRKKLYARGFRLLDRSAWSLGADYFHQLDVKQRIKVLKWLDGRREGQEFVRKARADVMRVFYAYEVGQRTVGYRPPNQGYLQETDTSPINGSKP